MPIETVPTLTLTPADVADLADAPRPSHAISSSCLSRSESRAWTERSLHGLLSPLERKSVEPIVIAHLGASDKAMRGMQQFLTASTWDDAAILRRHWQEVAVDWTTPRVCASWMAAISPRRAGTRGGKRQSCGELGKIARCQAGVFLAYASPHGATRLDRRLSLPQAWLEAPVFAERRARGVASRPTAPSRRTTNWPWRWSRRWW